MREESALSWPRGGCPACGYTNAADEARCEKCGRKLPTPLRVAARSVNRIVYRAPGPGAGEGSNVQPIMSRAAAPPQVARPPQAVPRVTDRLPENTRKQLSRQVQAFRSRQLNRNLPLQFEEERQATPEETVTASNLVEFETVALRKTVSPPSPKVPRWPRHIAPPIEQPTLDFPSPELQSESFPAVPVAPFGLRLLGHAGDLALTLAALLLFLIPLRLLAGPIALNRVLLAGVGGAYLVLVLLYGFGFLCLAGATPTMKWVGLRLVNFDGAPPLRRQLFYRFLGAIASVGSFFLGFLWAAVDEETLSWHDRISKTFLTVSVRRPTSRE